MNRLFCIVVLLIATSQLAAQDKPQLVKSTMQLEADSRGWFTNPDGSCVQCSIAMTGIHCNYPQASYLLVNSPYGARVRGGSYPGRVTSYCNERGIKAWNVTGIKFEDTRPWMLYAVRTGRFAAIGAGRSHFQTLYGYVEGDAKPWKVCNNNSTNIIDSYSEAGMKSLHESSGPWVVVLQRPSSENPQLVKWWR